MSGFVKSLTHEVLVHFPLQQGRFQGMGKCLCQADLKLVVYPCQAALEGVVYLCEAALE